MHESPDAVGEHNAYLPDTPRSWVWAAVLTFIQPGLGHVYAGQMRRALAVYGLSCLCLLLRTASLAYIPVDWWCAVVALTLFLGFRLGCIVDVVFIDRGNRLNRLLSYQKWWVYVLVWVLGIGIYVGHRLMVAPMWIEPYVIPTGGMSDTLMAGDRIMAENRVLINREIRHGDVIIFYHDGPGSYIFVQRVIGLPGDVIEFKDEQLIRNGSPIDEPYVKFEGKKRSHPPELYNLPPQTVPDGELFMVGDNRRLSHDSRSRGTTPISDVIGHVMTIYFSRVPQPLKNNYPGDLSDFGIDEDNPSGMIRWNRFGKRVMNSDH